MNTQTTKIEGAAPETPIYYDYQRQAWIVNGKVDKCGHPTKTIGCYACSHAGEEAFSQIKCEHELGLYGICKKCGVWPIATEGSK